jgi:hypothetical protein
VLAAAADAGLDLARITAELEREGVEAFCDSYAQILSANGAGADDGMRARARLSRRLRQPGARPLARG